MVTESTGKNERKKSGAQPVPGETNIDDNLCIDGWILVTRAGDLGSLPGGWGAFDDSCNSDDFFLFRDSYINHYHPLADFNNDAQVDSDDFFDFRNSYIDIS